MKGKIIWLALSGVMVAALVLASCGPAAVEEEAKTIVGKVVEEEEKVVEEEEEEVVAGPVMVRDAFGNLKEEPRYGGTITTILASPTPTQILDPVISTRAAYNAELTYSRMGTADWSRGPQGNNEIPFTSSWFADGDCSGDVAESWDYVDPLNITFYLRQNVYWQNVSPMNGRQFTAEDVVYSFERAAGDPQSVFYAGTDVPEEEQTIVTAVDKFTVHFEYYELADTYRLHGLLNWLYLQPREVVEQSPEEDLSDPKHQVGTGAWILTDLVPDSSMTWKRNPNYHLYDPAFPDNRLPYADGVDAMVILDESTRLAALRTHKVERLAVPWDKVEGLKESNPELLWREVLPAAPRVFFVRTDIEPFSIKKVRQAIALAIDHPTIADEFYGGAYLLEWPMQSAFPAAYTPLEELPESSRMLYEYHPDLARQYLADAGYPNGFKTQVILPSSAPRQIDVCSIVKEYLAEVGIEMELKIQEPTTFGSTLYGKQYPGMAYLSWANNGIEDALGWANGGWVGAGGAPSVYNFGNVVDPISVEVFDSLVAIVDTDELNRIRKEENLRAIDVMWEIPMPTPKAYFFWVPWLKGYGGEVGVGPDPPENDGLLRYVWIDQDLKYEITGTRD